MAGRRHTRAGGPQGLWCRVRALERGKAFGPRRPSVEGQIVAIVRGTCWSVPVASASRSQRPPLSPLISRCVLFGDSFCGLSV